MLTTYDKVMLGTVMVSGAALGAALAATVSHLWPRMRPADCSAVGAEGGVVAGVPYLERMRGGADPNETVPMVVLFHSLGGSPKGFASGMQGIGRARLVLPEGELQSTASASGRKWWSKGVKVQVTQEPEQAAVEWRRAADRMAEFLRQIVQCRPTLGLPIVTGSSQGGEMALLMASTHPELVRSAVAVASYVLPPFWNVDMAPTRMIHGTGDDTVPYAWAKDYYEQMSAAGAPLAFESYSSPGHELTGSMTKDWRASVENEVEAATAAAFAA